jgi:hypothetical protein
MLAPRPFLVPRSKRQSTAIPLLSLRAFVAFKKGDTYIHTFSESYKFRIVIDKD